MKKQVKVTSEALLNLGLIVIVFTLAMGTAEARTHNKPSVIQVEATDERDGENNIEGWMGSDVYWGACLENSEVVEQESINSVAQWMVSGSLWQVSDPLTELQIEPWMNSRAYWENGVNAGDQKSDIRKHLACCSDHRKRE